MSTKALDIMQHIEELYSAKPDFSKLENNQELIEAYQKAFADYDLLDIIDAIDRFWEYKSNKSRPTVAQLKAMLNAHDVVRKPEQTGSGQSMAFAPAEFFMQRDIELKRCRHNLYIYKQAVDYIINELLLEKIPSDVWRKMSFADKVTAAKNNGLFSRLDEVLVLASMQRIGRPYEFQSEAELNASKASQASGHTFDEAVAEVANWWHN